jgi:hypothetical protein
MKFVCLIIAWTVVFLCTAHAQDRIDIYGYFESTIMGTKVKDTEYQLNTNKLRVDLKSVLTDDISFAANFDYITYHGRTTWNILDFLAYDIISDIPEDMRALYKIPFSDRDFLDNAYIKLGFEYLDLTVGKQQISLGSGYVWNPLDVFNIKDPFDPTYEQPGHNAIRIDVPIGLRYNLTALYSMENNWKNSAKLLRFKGRISHLDYTLVATETVWRFHDYTQFDEEIMYFVQLPERRRLVGTSIAGELLGLGTWAEYAYNEMEKTKDFYELVVGLDYTFDVQTYVMIEYYRNMLGKTSLKNYDINDWMRQFFAEQKAISRDQLYAFIRHPVTDLIDLCASCIYSVSDNSLALLPTLNYSYSENMDIMAYLNFNFGRDGAVYSDLSGTGGLLRARVYF